MARRPFFETDENIFETNEPPPDFSTGTIEERVLHLERFVEVLRMELVNQSRKIRRLELRLQLEDDP